MKRSELDSAAEFCPKCEEHYIPFLVSCNCISYKYDPDAMDQELKAIESVDNERETSENKGCDQES